MTTKWVPSKEIKHVLDREFVTPFINSIEQFPEISLKLSNAFVLVKVAEQLIVESDIANNDAGTDIEALKEKGIFLGYLGKIYQSALLLIGATDYIGAIVLMRSIFELLVEISAANKGRMRDRISSIVYLDDEEKGHLQVLWNELSAWAHPYGKWIKNVCPFFYGCGRLHHEATLTMCLDYSDQILDLLLTITIDLFILSADKYENKYRNILNDTKILDIAKLDMFEKRLKKKY
jgi:hypothetical protein